MQNISKWYQTKQMKLSKGTPLSFSLHERNYSLITKIYPENTLYWNITKSSRYLVALIIQLLYLQNYHYHQLDLPWGLCFCCRKNAVNHVCLTALSFKVAGFLFELLHYLKLERYMNYCQIKIFTLIKSTLIWD